MNPFSWGALAAILGAVAFSAWKRALLSLTLAIAIVLVFLLDYTSALISGLGPRVFSELAWINVPGVYVSPAWTIVTTIFVHAGFTHLMLNLLGFVLITPLLEERIGTVRWALVFFVGALFGELVFAVVRFGQPFILVGASGGLMAVLGAFARLYPRERITLFLPIPGLPSVPVIWVALGYLLLSFALFAGPAGGIAYEAHIGGLAFGLVFAPLIMRLPAKSSTAKVGELNLAVLEGLATTRELRLILDELKSADVPEVRSAWLDKFVANLRCPTCDGPVRLRRGALGSDCGWRQPL